MCQASSILIHTFKNQWIVLFMLLSTPWIKWVKSYTYFKRIVLMILGTYANSFYRFKISGNYKYWSYVGLIYTIDNKFVMLKPVQIYSAVFVIALSGLTNSHLDMVTWRCISPSWLHLKTESLSFSAADHIINSNPNRIILHNNFYLDYANLVFGRNLYI